MRLVRILVVATKNGNRLIFSGSFGDHTGDARNRACGYLTMQAVALVMLQLLLRGMLVQTNMDMYLYQEGSNLSCRDNYVGMMAKASNG